MNTPGATLRPCFQLEHCYHPRIATRNIGRIRGVLMVAATHTSVCGPLEELNKCLSFLDLVTASLGTHGLVSSSHLLLSRNLTSNVKALRTFRSTIHGCNLVLRRFTGGAKERSALLREYRKSCDKAGVSVGKGLLQWLSEEASNA